MEKQEIEARLMNDMDYALAFAANNQPAQIASSLAGKGINVGDGSPAALFKVMRELVTNGNSRTVIEVLNVIPYNPNPPKGAEWTAGFSDFFIRNTPKSVAVQKSFGLSGILGAVAGAINGFLGASQGQPANSTTPQLTQEQIEQMKKDEEERKKKEEEEKKRKTKNFIIGLAVVVILVVVIVIVVKKSKKKAS